MFLNPFLLEVMSEYLVMAADLIEMKSKMLIPKEKEMCIRDRDKIHSQSFQ